jgi:hypothetical protein
VRHKIILFKARFYDFLRFIHLDSLGTGHVNLSQAPD